MNQQDDQDQVWGITELVLCFLCLWIASITYQGFSNVSWFGSAPYTGACSLVMLSAMLSAFFSTTKVSRTLRVGAPLIFLILFYSASNHDGSFVESLQNRLELPHFILVSISALAAIFFTMPKVEASVVIPEPDKALVKEKKAETIDLKAFDRIVGQDHIISSLKEIARVTHSGIRVGKSNAPHAVLLFIGPTGVGKTEAATALAETVYGSKSSLIRFDMGQFTDASQASRFYGPPPGYVGSEEGGQLTNAVLRKPKSVVLLDEMEKAHPQIWDAFLPVFDEGYIVDGSTNKKVDMTNTIIVLTSNLLSGEQGLAQLPPFELKEKVAAKGSLRPELLGRINEILVFNSLDRESIAKILRQRLDSALWSLGEQGVRLSVEESEIIKLVEEVEKAKFGVRQIDDVVRTYLRKAISNMPKS